MSTAVVSGVVATMIEAHRTAFPTHADLTTNAIKAILQFTAVKHDRPPGRRRVSTS